MNLILLGAPGAGKGTQAKRLCKILHIPAVSTGEILRTAIKNESPDGLEAKSYMERGQLVPDPIVIRIISQRLTQPDCANGYILDGVPRTIAQAKALECAEFSFDHVISLEIPDNVILERLSGRRVCEHCGASYHLTAVPPIRSGVCDFCGEALTHRKDDSPQVIQSRLEIYHRETTPLIAFYRARNILRTVHAQQATVEETTELILQAMGLPFVSAGAGKVRPT